jgi:hypothetical protein
VTVRGLILVAVLSVAACGGSSPRPIDAAPGTPSSAEDGRRAADFSGSAIGDTSIAGTDGPSPSNGAGPDAGSVPPELVPDAATQPDLSAAPDAAVAPDLPPDTPPPRECTPGVRACLQVTATRLCSAEGRWLPGESCGAGSICSGGACVCAAGSCEDGVVRDEPGYIAEIAVAGTILHYRHAMGLGTDIRSVDLRTGAFGGVMQPAAGYGVSPGLAADASGALYWCRRNTDDMGPIEGALMLGNQVFAPGACFRPLLTPTHVLFMLDDQTGLFRVPRASTAPIVREAVTSKYPASFFATATHIYFASADDGPRLWSRIERVPLNDFTRPQTVAERAGFDTHIFDHMAVDDTDLYVTYQGQILRSPAAGGDFQVFWTGGAADIATIMLSDTHVYWSTVVPSECGCSESSFWRRSKQRDDEPTRLAHREGVCPNAMELTPERLYVVTAGLPGPSQILRLRR